jgi:glycosyltransferase involved in cell wall biosynthesis
MRLTVLNVSYPLARVSSNTAGGAEQVLTRIDEALVRDGQQSLVIAPAGSRCRGLLLPTPPLLSSLDEHTKQLAREQHREAILHALERFPVDVLHLHGVDFLDYLPPVGVPVIVTLHLPLEWYPPEVFHLSRPETYLVCVSGSQARSRPTSARMFRVIENGVPLVELKSSKVSRRRAKTDYALSMGRICPEKGFHLAMEACRRADIRFFLAGTVYNYPTHRAYFKQSIVPQLSRTQRFLGPIGGGRKLYLLAGAKCLLIPSLVAETSSLVAMEAMACGTPVIAFRAGALCDLIDHGRTGLLVSGVEEMAAAIPAVGELDPETCRREAGERFSAERMVANYVRLYEEITIGASQHSGQTQIPKAA